MERAASETGGASGGECEGEEQEDPSSSHQDTLQDLASGLETLDLEETELSHTDEASNSPVDELSAFRQQWKRELDSSSSPKKEVPVESAKPAEETTETISDEERAKQLFLKGVELERNGNPYEAIQHYKRAMQILPEVERRLYESTEQRVDMPTEEEQTTEVTAPDSSAPADDDEEFIEGEDLYTRFHRIQIRKGYLIAAAVETESPHLSWFPYEVVQCVLRWVVSSELDAEALERVAAVSRGLYVCARDPELWRAIAQRTWGIECGSPRALGYASWRDMYIRRARLRLPGCYISKTTYLRHGENSYQDSSYKPWYLIDYYRYLRFFPEGVVLMWTTAEEPASCVGQLKHRVAKNNLGIMLGHYRLMGDKVVIVIKKGTEKKPSSGATTRFRSRRAAPQEQHEQTFHIELELSGVRSRRNWQLSWRHYAVSARPQQWTTFELCGGRFPPFMFSPVRGYSSDSAAPLTTESRYS